MASEVLFRQWRDGIFPSVNTRAYAIRTERAFRCSNPLALTPMSGAGARECRAIGTTCSPWQAAGVMVHVMSVGELGDGRPSTAVSGQLPGWLMCLGRTANHRNHRALRQPQQSPFYWA